MTSQPWDRWLSERDRAVFEAAGYGQRSGPGERPALFVVDVTHDFVGDRPEPILDSITRFSNSCGEEGWRAMERIAELLAAFRRLRRPVFYTKGPDEPTAADRGSWAWKNARDLEQSDHRRAIGNEIPDLIAPLLGEPVIKKAKPSAFFGSPLASYLPPLGVDTIVVAGTTTSGCVRATVVDAFSLNYRVIVAVDAVFDRGELAHAANLFDMHAKYADVVAVSEIVDYIERLGAA
jgi:nicotinamidase-related amidase